MNKYISEEAVAYIRQEMKQKSVDWDLYDVGTEEILTDLDGIIAECIDAYFIGSYEVVPAGSNTVDKIYYVESNEEGSCG